MKAYLVLAFSLAMAACVGRSPQSEFYTLVPSINCATDDGACRTKSHVTGRIDVARVRIPEYVDRAQMVTVDGVNVHLAQDHRWAEGLGPMIQRQLISNLGTYLPGAVITDSNFGGPSGNTVVMVEIIRIDGTLGNMAQIDAVYDVMTDGGTGKPHRVRYTAPAGDTYGNYAAALSRMIDQMSADIAHTLAQGE